MKYFIVQLRVSSKDLGTILETVAGTAELKKVVAEDLVTGAAPHAKGAPQRQARKRVGQKTGQEIILETLAANGGSAKREVIEKIFKDGGFAPNSYSAAVSALDKAGKILRASDGTVTLRR